MVAQRMVQLDHLSRGRVIFGTGPGALPSDAHTLGIDPMVLRDRQDEAIGVIIRLLRGEDRFDYKSDWFELHDAALQILPLQEDMPMATASSISPSGMQLAGKYGIGVLSIASTARRGSLPCRRSGLRRGGRGQARLARRPAQLAGVDELAHRRDRASRPARSRGGFEELAQRVHRARPRRPGAERVQDPRMPLEKVAVHRRRTAGAAVIGTPDDLVAVIRKIHEVTGGFGVVLGFAHDWANLDYQRRSWTSSPAT